MAHIHCCTTSAFSGTAGIAIPFVDFPLGVVAAPIPEPATRGMLGLGLAGLGMLKQRRA